MNNEITACISCGLKTEASFCLIGTIMIRKKGKANDILDDLTVHNTTKQLICIIVYRCIFQVGTRFT